MITEWVLLLGMFGFLVGGAFFGDSGPQATFNKSGPRLAARIEQNISTGRSLRIKASATLEWHKPPAPPQEQL